MERIYGRDVSVVVAVLCVDVEMEIPQLAPERAKRQTRDCVSRFLERAFPHQHHNYLIPKLRKHRINVTIRSSSSFLASSQVQPHGYRGASHSSPRNHGRDPTTAVHAPRHVYTKVAACHIPWLNTWLADCTRYYYSHNISISI
jgi:hypothetical protein